MTVMRYLLVTVTLLSLYTVASLPDSIDCDLRHNRLFCRFSPSQPDGAPARKYYMKWIERKGQRLTEEQIRKGRCSDGSSCLFLNTSQKLMIEMDGALVDYPLLIVVQEGDYSRTSFTVIPCHYVFIELKHEIVLAPRWANFSWNVVGMPVAHYKDRYSFLAVCRSLVDPAETLSMTFSSGVRSGQLFGLRPFTSYRCMLKANYRDHENCASRWRSSAARVYRTPSDVPSAGPEFRAGMYQLEDEKAFCYVYYMPVPPRSRNGIVLAYSCVGDHRKWNTLNFKADCPHKGYKMECNLRAKTDKGWSRNSSLVTAQKTDGSVPELELWQTERPSVYITRLRFVGNVSGATLLICTCARCESRHPDCTHMTSVPFHDGGQQSVNLATQRVAVLVTADGRTVPMSEWVNCTYNATRDSDQVVVSQVTDSLEKKSYRKAYYTEVQLAVPAISLRCHYRPILRLYTKVECESKTPNIRTHHRPVGKEKMRFTVHVDHGCELLLSHNDDTYKSVFEALPIEQGNQVVAIILAVVVITFLSLVLIVVICLGYKRKKICDWFRKWRKRFTDDIDYESVNSDPLKTQHKEPEDAYEEVPMTAPETEEQTLSHPYTNGFSHDPRSLSSDGRDWQFSSDYANDRRDRYPAFSSGYVDDRRDRYPAFSSGYVEEHRPEVAIPTDDVEEHRPEAAVPADNVEEHRPDATSTGYVEDQEEMSRPHLLYGYIEEPSSVDC